MEISHPWFVAQPVIQGTWQGWIISDYVNPVTNERVPAIRAYFRIKQTYFNVYLCLMTAESSSDLLSGKLYFNDDGTFVVAGLYLNTPKTEVRDEAPFTTAAYFCTSAESLSKGWMDHISRIEKRSEV